MSSAPLFDNRPKVRLNRLPPNPEKGTGRFPSWLHRKLPKGGGLWQTGKVVEEQRLHTVCEEARCPNLTKCWSRKTATFLVMGKACTRACGFCDIDFAADPKPLEADEPARVLESVRQLDLRHVVITMVARDDLEDGGASHLAEMVRLIHQERPETTVELLTSDLGGNLAALDCVLDENPLIFNHNLETVARLTPTVRHKATYERSLTLLRHAKQGGKPRFVKSGIMVGLGETEEEVHQTLRDLAEAGVDVVTIGQYLQPNHRKLRVKEFVTPAQFEEYAKFGRTLMPHVYSGPFVRSSFNADLLKDELLQS